VPTSAGIHETLQTNLRNSANEMYVHTVMISLSVFFVKTFRHILAKNGFLR